jgi:hypothetical protein
MCCRFRSMAEGGRNEAGGSGGGGFLITGIDPHDASEERRTPQSPTRPNSSKQSKKSVRISSPHEPQQGSSQRISSDIPSQPVTVATLKRGKDARLLVPKAQSLKNRITEDENQSRRLLREIYSAENSLEYSSTKQKLIEFYLTTKFDSGILTEFAKQILSSTFDSVLKCDGEFDSSIEIENLLEGSGGSIDGTNQQINYLLHIANNFRLLVMDLCTRLLDSCGLPLAQDISYPVLCSPNLNMMMSCFRSFLSMHQTIQAMELSAAEKKSENFLDNLKQQKVLVEQELIAVQSELKALKVPHLPLPPSLSVCLLRPSLIPPPPSPLSR